MFTLPPTILWTFVTRDVEFLYSFGTFAVNEREPLLFMPDEDSIKYNNKTGKVELDFPEGLLLYQKFALVACDLGWFPFAILCWQVLIHKFWIACVLIIVKLLLLLMLIKF